MYLLSGPFAKLKRRPFCEKKVAMKKNTDMTAGDGPRKHAYPGSEERLPPTVASALVTASQEISASEKWVPARRGALGSTVPRLMSVIFAINAMVGPDRPARRKIRETSLRLLAYLPADLRFGAILEVAVRDPDVLDDLLSGSISSDHEVYRYNIFLALGVFARHGLVEEVFSMDRLDRVGRIVERTKKKRASEKRGRA